MSRFLRMAGRGALVAAAGAVALAAPCSAPAKRKPPPPDPAPVPAPPEQPATTDPQPPQPGPLPAPAVLPQAAKGAGKPIWPRTQKLNFPGQRAYWAFVNRHASVRTRPSTHRHAITRLHTVTGDGTYELVLVLEQTLDRKGRKWLRIELPIRPNNRTGWVRRPALGALREVHTWLIVDRRRLRATLIKRGRRVFSAPVGVGKPYWPTPRGEFYIRDRLNGFGMGTIYGPVAFGTSAKSAVLTDWPGGGTIGIHGTDEPGILPGHVSHGCIRMRNRDISRLARR